MNKNLKILITEDDPDVQEVLELLIQSVVDCEIVAAKDGFEALERLTDQKFDLITSDMNMPKMKGDKLYLEVRKKLPSIPFVLITSESTSSYEAFRGAKNFYHLEKPFTGDDIKNIFDKALVSQKEKSNLNTEYIPIRLSVLLKIQEIKTPLYIKISDDKYVKILNENAVFDTKEHKRFEQKQTSFLYIKNENFFDFIKYHQKTVFAKDAWNDLSDLEVTKELGIDLDLIGKASKIFGWTPEVIDLANQNIGKVIQLAEKNIKLQNAIEIFKTEKSIRLATHSIILTYLMTDIAKRLTWAAESTLQKIAFASVLHDINLDEDLFIAKQTLLQEVDLKEFPETPELKRIIEHPQKAAEIILNWPQCPPDVDVIIRQHHEKPDGHGFPLGLKSARISPLAALFILSEDVIYHCIENFGVAPKDYLLTKSDLYSAEPFKQIYKAMVEAFS